MKTFETLTLHRGGVEYTVSVEVNVRGIAEALIERASRNKSHQSKVCGGAVRILITAEVPTK